MESISVVVEHPPTHATEVAIRSGLSSANAKSTGDGNFDSIFVAARDSSATVIGGVLGEAYWGWVNFTAVWVHPDHRRRGLATRMLREAEAEVIRMGYSQAYLDTFSFQSPDLYLRLGYEIFGQLNDFPAGYKRLFMRKSLGAHASSSEGDAE